MVVLWHVPAIGDINDTWLIRGAYLFTDFFFVLSGFIIFENYFDRIRHGFSIARFMFLRFGRLYPLHVAVSSLFVLWELGAAFGIRDSGHEAFTGSNTVKGLLLNLSLLNAFGFDNADTWNFPAWSIGAEFYAYLLFALIIRFSAGALLPILAIIPVMATAVMMSSDHQNLDITYDQGFLRCIAGFAVGAICQRMRARHGLELVRNRPSSTQIEVGLFAAVILFVCLTGPNRFSFAAPFLFAFVILVFACEAGAVSRLLNTAPFRFVGKVSYSIYMLHLFILLFLPNIVKDLEPVLGMALTTTITNADVTIVALGAEPWQGTLAHILALAPVILLAHVAYRLVEVPARLWSRRIAHRIAG